jgi:small subunit ribosomal protein S1
VRAVAEDDEDFAAMFERTVAKGAVGGSPRRGRLKKGEVVEAIVVAIGDDTIFVDVGTKAEGRIDRSQLEKDGKLAVALGHKLRATVVDPGQAGPPQLAVSLRGGMDAEVLVTAAEAGTPVEGTFTKAVKAGIEVDIGGVRAFCPASQVDLAYVGDLETFVGQRHFFRVLEVKDRGRSVVVSRKALLQAERAEQAAQLRQRLQPGQELEGIVQSVQPYGAFVDLGGLQGLVHVSEMSRAHVATPSDVVSVGDHVRVQVLAIESNPSGQPGDVRVSLSMKALEAAGEAQQQPAAEAAEVISATVTKIESHGVFVDTPAGSGMIPTAELNLPPGGDPRRSFHVGDTIEVVAARRDAKGRPRFSARAVEEVQARRDFQAFREGKGKASLGSLGDLLRGMKLPDAPAGPRAQPSAQPSAPRAQSASPKAQAPSASPPAASEGEPRQRRRIKP